MIRLALYNPEIPQNTGTLLRLGACLRVPIDIIEPCGFVMSDRRMQRAGMDYIELCNYTRHENWSQFIQNLRATQRIVLITPSASLNYADFCFAQQDILVVGKESSGFPSDLEASQPLQVKIPMVAQRRSINVAVAAAMILGEALRQTASFPL